MPRCSAAARRCLCPPARAAGASLTEADPAADALDRLAADIDALRRELVCGEPGYAAQLGAVAPACRLSARNLVDYLLLRRADRRALQATLQPLGLSTLGSCEAHVSATLDAVAHALDALRGVRAESGARALEQQMAAFAAGSAALERNAEAVLGPSPARHRTRIIVTAPPEAATDPAVLAELLASGLNILRINCAHDGAENWARMVGHLRMAEAARDEAAGAPGPRTLVQFDLAGPKLRTGVIAPPPGGAEVAWKASKTAGDACVILYRGDAPPEGAPANALRVPLGAGGKALLKKCAVGDVVRLRDVRQRKRDLRVLAAGDGWAAAACERGGALLPGLKLLLLKAGAEDGDKARAEAEVAPELPRPAPTLLLSTGDTLRFSLGDAPGAAPASPGGDFALSVALPEVFAAVRPGHRVLLDDGKFEGAVLEEGFGADSFRVRLSRVSGGATKLAGEKGINLPDSPLALPAFGPDDAADLAAALALKPDLIALSFVQTPRDVMDLHAALAAAGAAGAAAGVLLKIETAAAFAALPSLLLAAMRRPRFAVMVARGDLAVEVGFGRLSEVQEEMLWLCEAAHAPVVWATQVLDSMARTGAPSRSEVTDAAMAGRAEAVMLNKGPFMADVLALLSDILSRLGDHERKKMHLLRRLRVADTMQLPDGGEPSDN